MFLKCIKLNLERLLIALFLGQLLLLAMPGQVSAATTGEPFPYNYEKVKTDRVLSKTFDRDGSEYQARWYSNSVFPIGSQADLNSEAGVDLIEIKGKANFFLTKYNPDGTYAWTKYIFYSNDTINGALGTKIEVSQNYIYWVAGIVDESIELIINEAGDTLEIENPYKGVGSVPNTVALMQLNKNGEYHDSGSIPGSFISSVATDYGSDDVYLGGGHLGTIDFDVSDTGEYELTSVGSEGDAYLSRYDSNLALDFAYSWPGDDQHIDIEDIEIKANAIYAGLAYNGNTLGVDVDMDPTSGVAMQGLHQHDLAIFKFDLDGEFLWYQAVTSTDFVGEYPWIDDEWFQDMVVDTEGNVYVTMYADSDVVQIGDVLYEKTVTGLNNVVESFIYKLNSDGEVVWSKYVASPVNNKSTTFYGSVFDQRLQKIIVVGFASASEGFIIDGVTYSTSRTAQVGNAFLLILSPDGKVESVTFVDSIGAGTLSYDNFTTLAFAMGNFANKTVLSLDYHFSATNLQADFDFSPTKTAYSPIVSGSQFFQLYYSLEYPAYSSSGSNSNNASGPSAKGCNAMPPGLKVPWLYGALAEGRDQIRLYFAPGDEPFNNYTIQYGTEAGNYPYGAVDIYDKEMRTLVVDELKPNTRYYFRIRSGNDCAPGEWSNELSAQTKK